MRRLLFMVAALAACMALVAPGALAKSRPFRHIDHFVVIYLENHSFDNLYGTFPGANGLNGADPAHTIQVDLSGHVFKCLEQNDPQLTSPPRLRTRAARRTATRSTATSRTRRSGSTATFRQHEDP